LAVQNAPLTSSQRTEILRRQAFKCVQCQTDLEPVGSAPAHFEQVKPQAMKGASSTANYQALCPACHAKSDSESAKASDEKRRRSRKSSDARGATKFVKSGFDTRKF